MVEIPDNPVKPGIFLVSEIDVFERSLYKIRIDDAILGLHNIFNFGIRKRFAAVLNQRESDIPVEGQQIVVDHALARIFEDMADRPCSAENVQHALKL